MRITVSCRTRITLGSLVLLPRWKLALCTILLWQSIFLLFMANTPCRTGALSHGKRILDSICLLRSVITRSRILSSRSFFRIMRVGIVRCTITRSNRQIRQQKLSARVKSTTTMNLRTFSAPISAPILICRATCSSLERCASIWKRTTSLPIWT